jgi:hypothetical protein
MKLGIKETKEMVAFIVALANSLGQSLEDGELGVTDILNFLEPLSLSGEAISGSTEVAKELVDLDESEKAEILSYIKETFSIPEKNVEDIVECSLNVIGELHTLILKVKNILKP